MPAQTPHGATHEPDPHPHIFLFTEQIFDLLTFSLSLFLPVPNPATTELWPGSSILAPADPTALLLDSA